MPITAPEALNHSEMAAKIDTEIGKLVRFQSISEAQEAQQMMGSGTPPPIIEAHLSIYRAIREGGLACVAYNVERVLGRRPATFVQSVRENAAAFY